MIDQNKFKEDVTEKFGSLTRFAQTINIQVLDIYKALQLKDCEFKREQLKKFNQLAETVEPKPLVNDWHEGLGKKIKLGIVAKGDNILNFTRIYPEYSNSWLSLVINDKKKTITPKIKGLCNLLNVSYVTE